MKTTMIWLVGNRGMLGSDVERFLAQNKLDYIASDVEVDITAYESLKNYVRDRPVSWIVNCSAYTAVDKAEDDSEAAFKINDEGVYNLARIAAEKNATFIHFSTDYVFDGNKEGAYLEEDKTNPIGVYGLSKLEGEKKITNMLSRYFIFRISWLYGKHGNNFVNTMLRLFSEREKVSVVCDQTGSPTYTRDVAEMVGSVIGKDLNRYGTYHYSNDGITSWFEFAQEIYRISRELNILRKDVEILPIPAKDYVTKASRPNNSYLSKAKIKKHLGVPTRPWRDSLREYLLNFDKPGP